MSEAKDRSHAWWNRPGLDVRGGRLFVAGRDAEAIARELGTPLYAHDLLRVAEQARALDTPPHAHNRHLAIDRR